MYAAYQVLLLRYSEYKVLPVVQYCTPVLQNQVRSTGRSTPVPEYSTVSSTGTRQRNPPNAPPYCTADLAHRRMKNCLRAKTKQVLVATATLVEYGTYLPVPVATRYRTPEKAGAPSRIALSSSSRHCTYLTSRRGSKKKKRIDIVVQTPRIKIEYWYNVCIHHNSPSCHAASRRW